MFETAELGRTISKSDFKRTAPILRQELLKLQDTLHRHKSFPIILLFSGVDGGGKGETVSLLNEWMDPRWLVTRAYDDPDDGERTRPEFWKYWRDLPARGRIGMFLSAWYSNPLLDRVHERCDEAEFVRRLDRIVGFERALARDGALILKFWMHLSRDAQEKRLRNLEDDPLTRARVNARDWDHWHKYDRFISAAEHLVSRTNRGIAPWTIIEGCDANYRGITVTSLLRDALKKRLEAEDRNERKQKPKKKKPTVTEPKSKADPYKTAKSITVLSGLDLTKRLSKTAYATELIELQARLHRLHIEAKKQHVASVLVFEGPDAAGKGGAIRRINESLDARNYQVHGIAAPTDEELAQHYLWRFWRHLPRDGHIAIFDRSWYGRVLVERIEGYASEEDWRRSYAEINDFEEQLIEHGIVLVKYWVHISKEEQLARFKLREKTPHKRWKLTEEDWRNRDKWGDYEEAVNDMVQYTSTSAAPWSLIAGNDKKFARVQVLKTFCDRLTRVLGQEETSSKSPKRSKAVSGSSDSN